MRPKVFVGSSKEGLPYARAIQADLDAKLEVTVWDQGVFDLSAYSIEALVVEARRSDFAILVFSPDDTVVVRAQQSAAVRDNVLFELGLFMGVLERKRVYVVAPADVPDFRIPTDLLGLTLAQYRRREDNNIRAAVGPACQSILTAIGKVLAADPEPGCAYEHTEETCHVIPLANNRFSVVFTPPMRCSPTLTFLNQGATEGLTPTDIQPWTRFGFTVTFPNPVPGGQLRFRADAKPPQL